jgi:hypothetical protein
MSGQYLVPFLQSSAAERVPIMSTFKTFIILLAIVVCAGCGGGSYYKVTEPGSGKVFYTEEVKRNGSAVEFKDATTGSVVTLQNSEVAEIDKTAYQSAVATPKK